MKEKWLLIGKSVDYNKLAAECNISKLLAKLLVNRDINTKEKINKYLNANLDDLYDGMLMKDMDKGIEIIQKAIEEKTKIVIYGDYDCDGISATSILNRGLKRCNANFIYYIPNREEEGYGMNSNRIEKLADEGCKIVLTCDNGIAAFNEVERAKELGMKVVLTDHHDIPLFEEEGNMVYKMPKADAVINPKRKDCNYPFKSLCGAGIAFKFIQCLYRALGIDVKEANDLIDICSIATVCDVVDLIDENRIIVKEGLKRLSNCNKVGIEALKKECQIVGKVNAYHLGFVIGPCINATGRLETADLSVKLLLTDDEEEAKELAKTLRELNTKRQELTSESLERVIEYIERENMENDKVMLVYDKEIHESIAGIVAGRVREKYNVPTIIMTSGKEMPKGSGRSIEEYNMFEELSKCKHLLGKFGGHPMAAGLSVPEENLPILRKELLEKCTLSEEDLMSKIRMDVKLNVGSVDFELLDEIEKMEPFGKANPSPIFGDKSVNVKRIWFIGKEKNIAKFRIQIGNYHSIDGISFDKGEDFKEQFINKYGEDKLYEVIETSYCDFNMDIVYVPSINEFNGKKSVQIVIKGIRL